MRHKGKKRTVFVFGALASLLLTFAPAPTPARETQDTQPVLSAKDKQTVADFDERVKSYVKLREGVEGKLPKLSKDSTPEQIEAHKKVFQEAVRSARSAAKHGDVFTADAAAYIRATIKTEMKGRDRTELRATVLEADTKGVPLRVNHTYPETKELVEMPPTLLLKLPQLPKHVKYRFVGRNMLLVDRENGLIVDYMTDALP